MDWFQIAKFTGAIWLGAAALWFPINLAICLWVKQAEIMMAWIGGLIISAAVFVPLIGMLVLLGWAA